MEKSKKILLPSGILALVYGDPGVGKSTLAYTYPGDPKKVLFIDGEGRKSEGISRQIGFDYINLVDLTKDLNEVKRFGVVKSTIENIKKKYDLIVVDNPVILTDGAFAYVVENMSKYRKIVRGNAAIIGAIQWKTAREVALPALYDLLRSKADMVLILAHEKAQSIEGVKTGGKEAHVDPSLFKSASPIIRLVFGNETPVPIGLMVKGLTQYVNGKVQNILPLRVKDFSWETIGYYMENPVGINRPNGDRGEIPDEIEYALIRSALTPEQRRLFEFNMAMAASKVHEEMSDEVIALIGQTGTVNLVSAANIAAQLKDRFPDLTAQKVMEIYASLKEVSTK